MCTVYFVLISLFLPSATLSIDSVPTGCDQHDYLLCKVGVFKCTREHQRRYSANEQNGVVLMTCNRCDTAVCAPPLVHKQVTETHGGLLKQYQLWHHQRALDWCFSISEWSPAHAEPSRGERTRLPLMTLTRLKWENITGALSVKRQTQRRLTTDSHSKRAERILRFQWSSHGKCLPFIGHFCVRFAPAPLLQRG